MIRIVRFEALANGNYRTSTVTCYEMSEADFAEARVNYENEVNEDLSVGFFLEMV